MNRRKFIGGTAAVVTAIMVPANPDGILLRSIEHPANPVSKVAHDPGYFFFTHPHRDHA